MTQPVLHIDFETRSAVDLREVGLYNYARHPTTDVWCMAYEGCHGDLVPAGEPSLWTPEAQVLPLKLDPYLRRHVEAGLPVYAHNAPFELAIWNQIMVPRYGWPELKPEQTYCTMAMSYAMGLPGSLEDAALATGLRVLKDAEGRALMLRMCRPRKTVWTRGVDGNGEQIAAYTWWDEPEKLARLYEYCRQDVRVERELHKRLMPLSDRERKVWLLDYKINQQGVQVDIESAKAAIKLAEVVKENCNAKLAEVTDGAATTVTALAPLKEWLNQQGCHQALVGLAKQDVADLLADDNLPPKARAALTLRQEAGKASNAKFGVMVAQAGDDGRLRNMYQYHGAATGRWAGRGVQVHNLPRNLPEPEIVERILDLVRAGQHDAIDAIYGPPLSMVSRCLRSFFMAAPGKVLVAGDWSNVESRGAAWFAGEQWKLEAFRKQDDGTGPEVYIIGASNMLGIPMEQVTKEQRQSHGKVPDLAFQYQGGIGSGRVMGKTYGVKATDEEWAERRDIWRAAHPAITATWPAVQRAAINAVRNPGTAYACGHAGREAQFKVVGSFLWCLLPSGRAICFPYPKVLEGQYGPQLTYMTVPDPTKPERIIHDPLNTHNWARVATYGGALFNRIIQGFCRDFLAEGLLALDAEGLPLSLHTHDSLSAEVDRADAERALRLVGRVMCRPSAWAKGFPLIAKPEVVTRYAG